MQGVLRGGCRRCGDCSAYRAPAPPAVLCAACHHPPGLHQNMDQPQAQPQQIISSGEQYTYIYMDYNLTALYYLYLHVKHNNLAGSPIMLAPDMRRMDPNTLLLVRTSDQACLLARGVTVRIRSTTTRRSVHLSTAVLGVEMRNYWNTRRTNCSRTLPDKLKNCTNYVETMVIKVYRVGGRVPLPVWDPTLSTQIHNGLTLVYYM